MAEENTFSGSIDLYMVDLTLLREQKQAVVDACSDDPRDHALQGLLNFLDYIQDCIAVEVGEEKVFGKLD